MKFETNMKTCMAIICTLLLTACASPQQLLADQAAHAPAERNASVSCISLVSLLYGSVTNVAVVLDRGALPAGSVSVRADCSLMIETVPTP